MYVLFFFYRFLSSNSSYFSYLATADVIDDSFIEILKKIEVTIQCIKLYTRQMLI